MKKKFCVTHASGRKPWPFLVWLALSWWGDEFDETKVCVNTIHFQNNGWLGTSTTRWNDTFTTTTIRINTEIIEKNGLFYNVLLHELGHANGLRHTSSVKIMQYTVKLYPNGTVVQDVPYFVDGPVYQPSPYSEMTYTGNFYDFTK